MAPQLPEGDTPPQSGEIPQWASGPRSSAFRVYVHVPFCRVRCGYCDFNTYTMQELNSDNGPRDYVQAALAEIDLAAHVMDAAGIPARPAASVFLGGGTPTMLDVDQLAVLLSKIKTVWGLADGAELTFEANPDSVTERSLQQLAESGFTRISIGMQSVVPHVLATLDRTHQPERVPQVVSWAQSAGLAASVDLIYGTPGESLADWRASVDAALGLGIHHISAYALVIEAGTKMAAQVKRGQLELPQDDDLAEKYEYADEAFQKEGLSWYEVSNWARTSSDQCQHNLGYWRGDDWWGVGPGAHSFLAAGDEHLESYQGLRWWNVKHPRRYAQALAAGASPAAGRELLTREDVALERVMLQTRLKEGLDASLLSRAGRDQLPHLAASRLIDQASLQSGQIVLTRRGRLLADLVVQRLTS